MTLTILSEMSNALSNVSDAVNHNQGSYFFCEVTKISRGSYNFGIQNMNMVLYDITDDISITINIYMILRAIYGQKLKNNCSQI